MKVFNCYKNNIEYVGDNSLFKKFHYNESVACFSITHDFCETNSESIISSVSTIPIKSYELVILDFSHFDFKLSYDAFENLNKLFNNLYFISNNWQLASYDNHSIFDPKLYKFEIPDVIDFSRAVSYNRILFQNYSNFLRPKKFINLTNHVRRERVLILDKIFSNKNEGYISFPDINKFNEEIKNIDSSSGPWEETENLIKNSSFYEELPLLFDLTEKSTYNSSSTYDITRTKNELVNVGLLFNYGMYLTSYLEIFSETFYAESMGKPNFPIHSSEKTINPIWAHLPLTHLDVKDKMMNMNEFGFSFDCPLHTPIEIDSMDSSAEKTNLFIDFCKKLIDMDIADIHGVYNSFFDEFIHNYETMVLKMSKPYIIEKIKKYASL